MVALPKEISVEESYLHGGGLLGWLTTVDHKRIGVLYGLTTLVFFLMGGIEALLMRIQLARPDNTFLSAYLYNEMFTMHGTTMIFLVVMPVGLGFFANFIVPLQIGARDVAFPRLNALSYWIFLFGALVLNAGWLANAGARRRLVRLRQPDRALLFTRPQRRFLDAGAADLRRRQRAQRDQPAGHDHQYACARDDLHAPAAVRVVGDGDVRADPGGVSAADRGADLPGDGSVLRHPFLSRWWRAPRRCYGSICSGCSAIPKFTSWCCRPSESCRSWCRRFRASRFTATR